jgi:hypothetical protein
MRYYFLGGYLPDIHRDDRKLRVNLEGFLEERAYMAPEDVEDIALVLLHRDVRMCEALLNGREIELPHSRHSLAFWREEVKKPENAPEFLAEFLTGRDSAQRLSPEDSGRLQAAYYDFALSRATSGLLKKYLSFEKDLKNILAALRARQLGMDVAEQVFGGGELAEQLATSNAEDFGLSEEVPWFGEALVADTPSRRQEVVEKILWDFLEESAGSDAFDFNAILAYMLKLEMLESRLALSAEAGMEKVRRLEEQ